MYSERDIIDKLRTRFRHTDATAGIGDDTAVVEVQAGHSVLFCSDLLAENTHFSRRTHPPDSLGFKSVAINVSDIGAMGGVPTYCVLSLGLPPDIGESWVDALLDGLDRACREFGCSLVGGDTARSERIFIDVAMIGWVEAAGAVRRGGARAGDDVYVTGTLGNSAKGLSLLDTDRSYDDPAILRHLYPIPRHRVGRALRELATAMIDVSDGLSRDLGHILQASGVSAEIQAGLVPRENDVDLDLALHGGEDYELIVTGRDLPGKVDDVPLTRIGKVVPSSGDDAAWLVAGTARERLDPRGFEHFG